MLDRNLMNTYVLHLFLLLVAATLSLPISATEFIFNTFDATSLLLYGNATIQSSTLSLTSNTSFSIGRALYPIPVVTKTRHNSSQLLTFSTSFVFSISPYPNLLPGHGFTFLFTPYTGINGTSSAQNLGLLNLTNDGDSNNHVFAIKFDVFQNQEFNDLSDNHVGINVNSLSSSSMHEAGYWVGNDEDDDDEYDVGLEFRPLRLNNGENYQVWIDYADSRVNVTMAPVRVRRPVRPLISYPLDISNVLLDEMYVGFTAATGALVESHKILCWSFSNSNFSIGDALINGSGFEIQDGSVFRSVGFIVGITMGCVMLICGVVICMLLKRWMRNMKGKQVDDAWEFQYWPHRMNYQEIHSATSGFCDENVIGFGGNGKVYKGVLVGGFEVAVKLISLEKGNGMGEFLAEVSTLGRLKHRNLVGLRGWCKKDDKILLLIYDYVENGSLDKWIFSSNANLTLNWSQRKKILKDVASGILYLHEGWEVTVLHRDIKTSNVLLDKDMNAKLADFGLARMHHHGQSASTTGVVGTIGYIAPEFVRIGRPSVQTDVFSFGVLILEVLSGRKAVEQGYKGIVEWASEFMERRELVMVVDEKLTSETVWIEEMEKILLVGLWCTHPNPDYRPSIRVVLTEFEGKSNNDSKYEEKGMYSQTRCRYNPKDIGIGHPLFGDIPKELLMSSSKSLSASFIEIEGR